MEVDEIELQRQVSKFQRVSSNGSTTTTDNSSNPVRIASNGDGAGGGGGGDVVRVCGWPSSRIVRVSRASGGKDRHSKVLTSKGLRDRRVRLSVNTAIQFYDLQDRLGYDQPSKAVEWLLKAAASSIDELPSLDPPFLGQISDDKKKTVNVTHQTSISESKSKSKSKSPACSSTSETSKGSGLSLSRSENRNKARERAREMASHKKELDDSARVTVLNQVNCFQESSPFTDLLTGRSPMDYFFNRSNQPAQLIGIPQFHNPNPNQHQQHHQFSFLQDSFVPTGTTTGGGGETYNLNFGMTSPSPAVTAAGGGGVIPGGYSRGTLQSNLQQSLLPHQHHLHPDGSTSANLPFFIVPNAGVDHYSAAGGPGGYHLGYGGDAGGRRSDHHKEKSKN